MKISAKEILTLASLVGLGISATLVLNSIPKISASRNATVTEQQLSALVITLPTHVKIAVDLPKRLIIPKIGVDASVEFVGLAKNNTMEVPQDPANAAWLKTGPRPGEIGSAVMVGHYGWADNEKLAFNDLGKLRTGDKVYVQDDEGMVLSFIVHESRSYDPDADADEVYTSRDGESHLNLVTCEGDWNEETKDYPKRRVVFTDRE